MKFISAVTALVAALAVGSEAANPKNKKLSKRELNQRMKNGQFDKATIMKNAKPHSEEAKTRSLMDISGSYSVQFQSCFSLTTSYEDLFDDEDGMMMNLFSSGNILALQSYAIFRLCYGTTCNANGNEGLLEYVVDLNTYVQSLVNYLPNQMEGFCEACQDNAESCQAQLYGQYGNSYQDNANAYRYGNYQAGDNNYNGNNVNNVNYNNGYNGGYGNGGQNGYQNGYQNNGNGGNRKLSGIHDFQQRVLENQIVRQLDCQLCEEYNCLDDDDANNENYGYEAATEWLQTVAQCQETGISYSGGYNNNGQNGGQYYYQNQQNNNNDDNAELYAGIICNADGSGIEIGMFYDEDCYLYLTNESYSNYMSYFDQTYQQMTKDIVEFTFSNAVFSCKEEEIVYTTQDLSNYNGQYNGNYNWDDDDDDVAEWCEDLVSGDSEPVDMASCGTYQYYNGGQDNYQDYNGGDWQERYNEYYDQYQQQDQQNQYMYQYDWYRYEIGEDDALDMMEVCKVAKQNSGELHTFYNSNNGNLYSYSNPNSASDSITEFIEATENEISFAQKMGRSGAAKFGIVAMVGLVLGSTVALYLRFRSSVDDDKNVGLIDPDEVETTGGEVA